MQGFIRTTAGLRPLLLKGIEGVSYSQYSTANQTHGILAINYIANTGIGGGNVFVWIPNYTNQNYPIERFWDWVADVANGNFNKTLNSYYDNQPFVAIQTSNQSSSYTQSQSFVYKLADDATVDDACNHAFETADVSASGVNTFVNVVTNNSQTSNPNIGDKVYVSTNQGYTGEAFQKGHDDGSTPNPNNPTLVDGTYSYLSSGNPSWVSDDGKGGTTTEPQSGTVWRVKIKTGFITEAALCPIDFTQLGGVDDVDGYIFAKDNGYQWDGNKALWMCWDKAIAEVAAGNLNSITSMQSGGKWLAVKFGFLLYPNSAPQDMNLPPSGEYTCNYDISGKASLANIPQNAEVFMFDPGLNAYKKLQSGNTWTIDNQAGGPPVPETWSYDDFGYDDFQCGPSIVVPPQKYYGTPADPDYAFEYDWGPDYPDQKGADLVCTYFVSQSANPFDFSIPFSVMENPNIGTNGNICGVYIACGALMS